MNIIEFQEKLSDRRNRRYKFFCLKEGSIPSVSFNTFDICNFSLMFLAFPIAFYFESYFIIPILVITNMLFLAFHMFMQITDIFIHEKKHNYEILDETIFLDTLGAIAIREKLKIKWLSVAVLALISLFFYYCYFGFVILGVLNALIIAALIWFSIILLHIAKERILDIEANKHIDYLTKN